MSLVGQTWLTSRWKEAQSTRGTEAMVMLMSVQLLPERWGLISGPRFADNTQMYEYPGQSLLRSTKQPQCSLSLHDASSESRMQDAGARGEESNQHLRRDIERATPLSPM